MRKHKLLVAVAIAIVYLLIKYLVPYGMLVMYPVSLIVTFLHEFGHAVVAKATGGEVLGIQINPEGGGFTSIQGGRTALILMSGYIGSAILGNLLLYSSIVWPRSSKFVGFLLSGLLVFTAIFWFYSVVSSLILLLFAVLISWVSLKRTEVVAAFLSAIGILSIVYIVEDYNVGPSSDLAVFTKIMGSTPYTVWMILWLVIVLVLSVCTLRLILRKP